MNPLQKLGRKAVKHDSRTLRLARYLTAKLPAPPAAVSWSPAVKSWTCLLNDSLFDCTIAGILHLLQCQSANAGGSFIPTDAEALQYYKAIDGYNPSDPSTDQGGVELDVLNFCKQNGIAGQAVTAYASLDVSRATEVMQGIFLFGGIYAGVSLPVSAQDQDVWDVVPGDDGGMWGGHAVPITDYDQNGLTCITWGATKKLTWAFWKQYFDEAYAVLSPDFIGANGLDPQGAALEQLQSDLALIR